MSANTTSWLDRIARRAAGAPVPNHGSRIRRSKPQHRAQRVTRSALLARGYQHRATRIPNLPQPTTVATTPAEGISRRTTLKLAAAIAATDVLLKPSTAQAYDLSGCIAACEKAHADKLDHAINACARGYYRTFRGFSSFLAGLGAVSAAVDLCLIFTLAQQAYYQDACIAGCADDCHPNCTPFLRPLTGGTAPPPKAVNFGGCGCVGGDTCCACVDPSTGQPEAGCCIYADCRCCP